MTAEELLDRGIAALTRADVQKLESLAETAPMAEFPKTESGREAIRRRRRTLEHLLSLTARNLRLMGRDSLRGYGYELPRS